MISVPRVVSHVALDGMVKVLENAQNALLDNTKVKKSKPRAVSVKKATYQTINQQDVKSQRIKSKKTATTTTNTSTSHLPTKTTGHASHVHLVPLALVILHGIMSLPSMVIGD